jgi:hypothetical protein
MSVYDDVTAVSKHFLGPAAEQFIARQCQLHLKIEAPLLNKSHLAELAKAVEVAGLRYMEAAKTQLLAQRIARC